MSGDRLVQVGTDVWAWLAHTGTWGWSNAGLVAAGESSLLVDTLYDEPLTAAMLRAMQPVLATRPLVAAVNTHGNGDHCFGNALLPASVPILAGPLAADDLRAESPQMLTSVLARDLGPVVGPFVHACFDGFDFASVRVRPPDRTVSVDTDLDVGGRTVRLLVLGPAHSAGDVAVHVPDAGVVFAGDLLFARSTPVMWAGPVEGWIGALDRLLATGAEVVVPGHGPLAGPEDLRSMRGYLELVRDHTLAAHAAGRTWWQAATEIDLGPHAGLPEAERVVVTVHTIYRLLAPEAATATPVELFARMAAWKAERAA